ncbi:LysR family transcriptional regulator [Klebsiella pneumoniae]
MINLQRLDLNLLRTLDVLLSENNVTRAAQRLNLSQPSVSIQLARLREIFADPLLMPGPRGMQPTARADELRQPLRGQSGLVVVEPPLAVAGFEMLMLWHERWHRDPAHQWLRQFIVNSLEEQTC